MTRIDDQARLFALRVEFPRGRIQVASHCDWLRAFEAMVRPETAEIARTVLGMIHDDIRRGIL